MRKFLILIVFVFCSAALYGQVDTVRLGYSVQGNVVDATTGRPMEAVHVSVPSKHFATVTNADGDFTIKQFRVDASGNRGWLVPWNKNYPRIEVQSGEDFRIWGVVTYVIHAIHGLKTKYHVRNNP